MRLLNRFGGCGQDNGVGLSRTQFLADVGFNLRDYEVRLRRKIFSVAECRRRVVVTAGPDDPGATLEPRKKSGRRKTDRKAGNVVRAAALARDGGLMMAQ
jgi:hypothetical protein